MLAPPPAAPLPGPPAAQLGLRLGPLGPPPHPVSVVDRLGQREQASLVDELKLATARFLALVKAVEASDPGGAHAAMSCATQAVSGFVPGGMPAPPMALNMAAPMAPPMTPPMAPPPHELRTQEPSRQSTAAAQAAAAAAHGIPFPPPQDPLAGGATSAAAHPPPPLASGRASAPPHHPPPFAMGCCFGAAAPAAPPLNGDAAALGSACHFPPNFAASLPGALPMPIAYAYSLQPSPSAAPAFYPVGKHDAPSKPQSLGPSAARLSGRDAFPG